MKRVQGVTVLTEVPGGTWRDRLGIGAITMLIILGLFTPASASAQQETSVSATTTTIAVGVSEPGYLEMITRLVKRYNTRDGAGGIDARHSVAIVPVDDVNTAMEAVESGRADMAVATVDVFNTEYGLTDGWARPIAVEVLTIATRRARLVRDPRQLRGLNVEIPANRSDRVVERMNQVLGRFGITMPSGSFISAGPRLNRDSDPFLRLCRSEYDVRVDMVIHPVPAFAGTMPCELRLMSFPTMPAVQGMGPGIMRHRMKSETYEWLNQDITSLGSAVALVQPPSASANDNNMQAGRDLFVGYLDGLAGDELGLLSSLEADLWLGRDPGNAADADTLDRVEQAETPQENVE